MASIDVSVDFPWPRDCRWPPLFRLQVEGRDAVDVKPDLVILRGKSPIEVGVVFIHQKVDDPSNNNVVDANRGRDADWGTRRRPPARRPGVVLAEGEHVAELLDAFKQHVVAGDHAEHLALPERVAGSVVVPVRRLPFVEGIDGQGGDCARVRIDRADAVVGPEELDWAGVRARQAQQAGAVGGDLDPSDDVAGQVYHVDAVAGIGDGEDEIRTPGGVLLDEGAVGEEGAPRAADGAEAAERSAGDAKQDLPHHIRRRRHDAAQAEL